ncbi:MAG: heme-copper oxidase subunit III family protein [Candidatus Bipolaricaulia bacterium]
MEQRERQGNLLPPRLRELFHDLIVDRRMFQVSWGKAMMWLFLVSDAFVFGSFLISYLAARITTTAEWPDTSEVFALHVFGADVPLVLIAIMTFILISSSGTMAIAVNYAYKRERAKTALFVVLTALIGSTFVLMQAFEWTGLIFVEGIRPWDTPMGADQFGASFFMLTGFHGLHVTIGVIYLAIIASQAARGVYDRTGNYERVEIAGLYWHFVDLVWVFIFNFFYLW